MLNLLTRNTVILVSTCFFAVAISAGDVVTQVVGILSFFAGGAVIVILENLARRCPVLRKFSAKTFLHEGAHYLAARFFRLGPVFKLGAHYIKYAKPLNQGAETSIVALAPLWIWWVGILVVIGMHFTGWPLNNIGLAMLFPLSYIGCPGNQPKENSDWNTASKFGSQRWNLGLLGVGIALQVIGVAWIWLVSA